LQDLFLGERKARTTRFFRQWSVARGQIGNRNRDSDGVRHGTAARVLPDVPLMIYQFLAQAHRLANHKSGRRLDGCMASVFGNSAQR
jgi:hypothetical protein